MNQETFEQIPIAKEQINGVDYMKEGEVVDVVVRCFNRDGAVCDVPTKVVLKITYTEPGLKGDTATNTLKRLRWKLVPLCACPCS